MQPIRISLGMTDQHLQAIGRVAVEWCLLEISLTQIILNFINMPYNRAVAITAHLSERTRFDMAKTLADQTINGHPAEKALKKLCTHITEKVYGKRNAIIHGHWGASSYPGKIALTSISAKGVLKFGPSKNIAPEDIEEIADEIEINRQKLDALRIEIYQLLPKSKP